MRSADECEMSRSCQSATFSSPTIEFARTVRAIPQMRSDRIGFRLCGIADEPFWPGLEFLLRLAHFGPLPMTDLQCDLFQRRCDDRQRAQIFGITVALNDLRRNVRGL